MKSCRKLSEEYLCQNMILLKIITSLIYYVAEAQDLGLLFLYLLVVVSRPQIHKHRLLVQPDSNLNQNSPNYCWNHHLQPADSTESGSVKKESKTPRRASFLPPFFSTHCSPVFNPLFSPYLKPKHYLELFIPTKQHWSSEQRPVNIDPLAPRAPDGKDCGPGSVGPRRIQAPAQQLPGMQRFIFMPQKFNTFFYVPIRAYFTWSG